MNGEIVLKFYNNLDEMFTQQSEWIGSVSRRLLLCQAAALLVVNYGKARKGEVLE